MIDWFLFLTPFLLLGIVALLGFVGCNAIFGINETQLEIPVTNVQPPFAPSAGGTKIQIFGTNLNGVDKVTFDGVQAASLPVSNSEVDAYTPAGIVGEADIVVSKIENGARVPSAPFPFMFVAISHVQSNAREQTTNPPISVSLPNTTQGNLLIATVSFGGPAGADVAVSDNLGNTFTQIGSGHWTRQSAMFYLPNIPGGAVTITAAPTGGATGPAILAVSEYQRADPTAAAVYNFSTQYSPSAGNAGVETISGVDVPLNQSGDLVYAVVFGTRDTSFVAAQQLQAHPTPITSVLIADSATAVTANQTIATDDTTATGYVAWVILALAIKA